MTSRRAAPGQLTLLVADPDSLPYQLAGNALPADQKRRRTQDELVVLEPVVATLLCPDPVGSSDWITVVLDDMLGGHAGSTIQIVQLTVSCRRRRISL